MSKKTARRVTRGGSLLLTVLVLIAIFLTSCNLTRTVTTSSQYYQKGDTSCVIQTKTVETYDGSLKR